MILTSLTAARGWAGVTADPIITITQRKSGPGTSEASSQLTMITRPSLALLLRSQQSQTRYPAAGRCAGCRVHTVRGAGLTQHLSWRTPAGVLAIDARCWPAGTCVPCLGWRRRDDWLLGRGGPGQRSTLTTAARPALAARHNRSSTKSVPRHQPLINM